MKQGAVSIRRSITRHAATHAAHADKRRRRNTPPRSPPPNKQQQQQQRDTSRYCIIHIAQYTVQYSKYLLQYTLNTTPAYGSTTVRAQNGQGVGLACALSDGQKWSRRRQAARRTRSLLSARTCTPSTGVCHSWMGLHMGHGSTRSVQFIQRWDVGIWHIYISEYLHVCSCYHLVIP